ncbi:hypothetical protein BPOR_0086g00110 [Botrytis porri]|uniref:Uncharacterized protein n=1 Tax=Botrytis porri TaxID=87229 RepID=A0A4Z1KZM1_9HELO|nr:hypothetical protein BPOR_0086g00110 [Botrytis porri]
MIERDKDFQDFDFEDQARQEYYELENLEEEISNNAEYAQHAIMELRDDLERTKMLPDSAVADY